MSRSRTKLPPLAFGGAAAKIDTDDKAMSERVGAAAGFDVEYRATDASRAFLHCSASVEMNGLRLLATASTPLEVRVAGAKRPSLLIPFHGSNLSAYDNTKLDWNANESAVLLPASARRGENSERSVLIIDIDPERLERVAHGMLGDRAAPRRALIDLDTPAKIALHAGGIAFSAVFGQLCRAVDQFAGRPDLLAHSGLDDCFYRTMVMMLAPQHFLAAPRDPCAGADRADRLERLCEYIRANLDQHLTLTQLEAASGLSARALQYAFMKRFNCSPMRWVTEQKLLAIHALLRSARGDASVADIAIRYFSNLGAFARRYQRKFGQLPGKTLRQTQAP